jgi:formylglycine-generating enzyme required for sulfatase activity
MPRNVLSYSLPEYQALSSVALDRLAPDLRSHLPDGWETGSDQFGLWARLADRGLRFRLLPGGTYRIGLSEEELAAAVAINPQPNLTVDEMRPVHDVKIDAVLVGEIPITRAVARQFAPAFDGGGDDHQPAMLSREEAITITENVGCRLPSEAEWEASCRAGSSTLFPWGSSLPEASTLDRWMTWSLAEEGIARNPLGLGGLFFGEWCSDAFRVSHDPDAAVEPGAFVIKGGGAQFWPWQDQEWVGCACAMRTPSTDLFADQRCAARPVRELHP